MADFVFNIAAGRVGGYIDRVNANDPANSAIVIVAINAGGVSDATLKDLDDLAAILATAADEVTNGGYARKTLTDASSLTYTVTDASDKAEADAPDQTFASILAGTAWTDLIACYDNDTTAGTDANLIPLVQLDCAVTPDGTDIIASFNASGFFRATT